MKYAFLILFHVKQGGGEMFHVKHELRLTGTKFHVKHF